ncbi:hypothetical protein FRC19_010885 [Serendipita sp. 401]|nr:hypothetical protein FRC15_011385 [Serendipita sp. 397]KAG8818082.1 hypothetical protein FRC19_010885 [Serendipita sp. 401]
MLEIVQSNDVKDDVQALTMSTEAIDRLSTSLADISRSFVATRDNFSKVETELANDTEKLMEEWQNLRSTFIHIDQSFKGASGSIRLFLEALEATVIGPAAKLAATPCEKDLEEIKDEIEIILEKSADIGKASLLKSYKDFEGRLSTFQKRSNEGPKANSKENLKVAKSYNPFEYDMYAVRNWDIEATKKTTPGLKELEEQRSALVNQIQQLSDNRKSQPEDSWILWLMTSTLPDNFVAWFLSLLPEKEDRSYHDLRRKIIEIEQRIRERTIIQGHSVEKLLSITTGRLRDISGSVNILDTIWTAGVNDIKSIRAYLDDPINTEIPWVLRSYDMKKGSIYKGMREALAKFSIS